MLCIGYFIYKNSFQKIGVIQVTWFDSKEFNEMAKYTHIKIDLNTFRKYTVISFNDNVRHNEIEQERLSKFIRNLSNKKDSVNAIKILFAKGAIYKDFVSAVDAGYQYGKKDIGTMPYNDKIYI